MNKDSCQTVQYAFLDSGIGGVPYFDCFHRMTPHAQAVYVADTAHFPYGEKSKEEIIGYACEITKKIIQKFNPAVLVIACNTLSVTALDVLRNTFSIPFIGTVPAIKTAAERSVKKRIGIIATERTINEPYLDNLLKNHAADCITEKRADPLLVSQIENGLATASYEEKKKAVTPALEQFKSAGVDTLVLACTHFLHVADVFAACGAPKIAVIDSREGVINQIFRVSPPTPPSGNTENETTSDTASACYITGEISAQTVSVYRSICKQYCLNWRGVLA